MVSRQKQMDAKALADLACRKLNLGRATWLIESAPRRPATSACGRRMPGRAATWTGGWRTAPRAQLEPPFLAAVAESVSELRRTRGDQA